jgi:hypothetical protein
MHARQSARFALRQPPLHDKSCGSRLSRLVNEPGELVGATCRWRERLVAPWLAE